MTAREFELSRRDLLRYAARGAALLGTGGPVAACRSSTTTTTTPSLTLGGTL